MRVLIEARHPAHVHHFKFLVQYLKEQGHEVKLLALEKDITVRLLKELGLEFLVYGKNKPGIWNKALEILRQDLHLWKLMKEFKPDLVVGRPSHPLTFVSWLQGIPSIIFAEDDAKTVMLNAIVAHPFADILVTPKTVDLWIFEGKKVAYSGTQKLAYLHPNRFQFNPAILEKYKLSKPYCILRLSALSAAHDIGKAGVSDELLDRIIELLKPNYEIHISSEKRIPKQHEHLRLKTDLADIHHVMSKADLFICDSQSMAVEASLLGVPNIRYSSFVGKSRILAELEDAGLSIGIVAGEEKELMTAVEQFAEPRSEEMHQQLQTRRAEFIASRIDVTRHMIWLAENYPNLRKELNPKQAAREMTEDKFLASLSER